MQAGVLDLADGVHLGVVVEGRPHAARRLGLQEEPEVLVPLLLPFLLRVRQHLEGDSAENIVGLLFICPGECH